MKQRVSRSHVRQNVGGFPENPHVLANVATNQANKKKPDVCVTPGFESSRRKRNPVSLPEAIRVRIGLGNTFHLL